MLIPLVIFQNESSYCWSTTKRMQNAQKKRSFSDEITEYIRISGHRKVFATNNMEPTVPGSSEEVSTDESALCTGEHEYTSRIGSSISHWLMLCRRINRCTSLSLSHYQDKGSVWFSHVSLFLCACMSLCACVCACHHVAAGVCACMAACISCVDVRLCRSTLSHTPCS